MRYAIILAGGSGTRLWPLSRQGEPKQLLPLVGGRSLLELAWARLEGVVEEQRRLVCAAERLRGRVTALLGLPGEQYLGEPQGRDTLAAIALSAAVLASRDPEAVMGVFPSDHLIEPAAPFAAALRAGFERAETHPQELLTFGLPPARAATSFGYLELGEELGGGARRVSRFREKPGREAAEAYLAAGPDRYLWNSGIFVWRAATFLEVLGRYEPEVRAGVAEAADAWWEAGRAATLARVYPALKRISVDYAVLEPASTDGRVRVAALPLAGVSWQDIGSWPAYASTLPADAAGNRLSGGRALVMEGRENLVVSTESGHLVAVLGADELIVIHTTHATLVCPKSRAEEIRGLQARVETGVRRGARLKGRAPHRPRPAAPLRPKNSSVFR